MTPFFKIQVKKTIRHQGKVLTKSPGKPQILSLFHLRSNNNLQKERTSIQINFSMNLMTQSEEKNKCRIKIDARRIIQQSLFPNYQKERNYRLSLILIGEILRVWGLIKYSFSAKMETKFTQFKSNNRLEDKDRFFSISFRIKKGSIALLHSGSPPKKQIYAQSSYFLNRLVFHWSGSGISSAIECSR